MAQRQHIIRKEIRELLWLAGPVVVTHLAQVSMGFIDTVMVGRLGSEALAAVALGNTTFFFFLVVCIGVITAVGPMVSQAFGAGAREAMGRAVRQGFWLSVMLAVPAVTVLWNVAPVWRWTGQDAATVVLAQDYLRAIVWGFLPVLWFVTLRSFVEGVSRPWPVTLIALSGAALNVGANLVFMFGAWGIVPAMGLVGTGWASTLVFWTMFVLLVVYVQFREDYRRLRLFARLSRPDPQYFRELFRIGWPIGVSTGIETGLFMVTTFMMGWIGTTALAAHQIAIQCAAFTFMVPLGVGVATSVRVGQAVGRGAPDEARRAGYVGILLATLFMMGAAVLFWTVPESIVGLYLGAGEVSGTDVAALATSLLGVAAVFQVFDGVQVAAAGALRGLKDTRVPMLIAFFSYWLLGLSIGYVLAFEAEWDAVGLWWGLVVGLISAAGLLIARFRKRMKTHEGFPMHA